MDGATADQDTGRPVTTSTIRLHGTRRTIAYVIWAVLILLTLVILAKAISTQLHSSEDTPMLADIILANDLGISTNVLRAYGLVLTLSGAVTFIGVALILFSLRSNDFMVILTSIMLATFGGVVVNGSSGLVAGTHASWKPLAHLIYAVGMGSFVLFLYLFPGGRFVPRWSGIVAIGGVAWFALISFVPDLEGSGLAALISFAIYGGSLYFGTSPRYRDQKFSGPEQEQQFKWIIGGLTAALVGFVIWTFPPLLFPALQGSGTEGTVFILFAATFMTIALMLVPIAIGFSLAHYRLWDVDFVINRSMVYLGLTIALAVLFAIDFIILHAILKAVLDTEQAGIALAVSAAVAAGFFNPTRNWLRRQVDRRIYGIELDYQKAIKVYRRHQEIVHKKSDTATSIGEYTNLELLGRGGMGEVYLGQHPTLKRSVAIKVMPDTLIPDTEARKRFIREAQVTAGLKHPNIVQVFDVGEMDDRPYMVMEYVEGQDIGDILKERGRLPLEEALPFLEDVASALDYAHTQGVVHRDIKPSNVMIAPATGTGIDRMYRAVLMDFGIAKIYSAMTQLTGTNMVGTLDYIAPEQIQGAAKVDGRADIYSFGVMAYQILTGELPFKHNNPGAILMAHLMQPPPDPRDLADDLPSDAAHAIVRAMAKKPDDRYPTAGEMVAALN